MWDDDSFDGQEKMILSGYQRFPEALAESDNIRVLLNHEVVKIHHSGGLNTVTFRNGKWMRSKFVVISVPLGVLKANKIQFEPELPKDKRDAISSLGFGNVCKVLLCFQKMDFLDINQHYIGVVSSDVGKRGLATYLLNLHALASVPALMTFGLGPNAD